MRRVKQYKLYKTAQKTARENNLVIAEKKSPKDTVRMFDFAELEGIPMSEIEKEVIQKDALDHVGSAFLESFYGREVDNFFFFDGVAKYHCHRVYDEQGRLLYRIFQLVEMVHRKNKRRSVYEKYTQTAWEMPSIWSKPDDIEI